ncbi:hypothetical protein RR42_m1647 [Cupriavidus basilensis]|uniref:Uncharacterized protein n=1 Tax=Cupriavidus basilensis TaxID=68895 RepID=A0A0C4Y9V5_9BURK|nr:hypothetical protein RR42_m1647 [Cupriavidus basilensis]
MRCSRVLQPIHKIHSNETKQLARRGRRQREGKMGNECHHRVPLQKAARPARARLLRSCAAICVRRSMVIPPVGPYRDRSIKRESPRAPSIWRIPSAVEQSRHLTFPTAHKRGMHERTRHHGSFCCQREDRPAFGKRLGLARALLGKLARRRSSRQTHFTVVRATARSRAAARCATRRASSISSGVGSGSARTEKLIPPMERRRATRRLPTESQSGFMCLSPAVLFRFMDRSPRVAFRRPRDGLAGRRSSAFPTSLPVHPSVRRRATLARRPSRPCRSIPRMSLPRP